MGTIFISHSSKDSAAAAEVAQRLKEQGHTSVFLDFHPEDGIPAGRAWERELYHRLRACRATIVLCSKASMASQWCFAEITHARSLGKHLIPIRIDDCEVADILQDLQTIDLVGDPGAYDRLWSTLRERGLDPGNVFEWDRVRPPFPGLLAFQEADTGIYFGRDDMIREGLDALNRLRQFGAARLLVVLGASGSGKSSLVQAGLLPRLRRDPERWLVLDSFRPEGDPVATLTMVVADAYERHGRDPDLAPLRAALREALDRDDDEALMRTLQDLALDLRRVARTKEARVLLTIDQSEELLDASLGAGRAKALRLVRALAECRGWRVVATLRSDYLGEFQGDPILREMAFESLPVGPLSTADLRRAITGPAELAGLDIEPALVDALAEDALAQDALPLLAFALREIWERRDRDGRLRLEVYQQALGGLEGAVASTAEHVMNAARPSKEDEEALRHAFLGMTRLGEDGQYSRRVQRWRDVDARAKPLLDRFVQARLLVSRGDEDVAVVEVAHEAIFRSWERLTQWLVENREMLRARARVEAAARRWEQEGRHHDYLLPPGRPLTEAAALLSEHSADLADVDRAFVEASVAARDAAQAAEREAEEKRRRRARQLLVASLGALVLLLALGVSVWLFFQARDATRQAEIERDSTKVARAEAVKAKGRAETERGRAEAERDAADAAKARTETLRRANRARSLALESEGGSPLALVEALRAVVPDLAAGRTPHTEAEGALRIALRRMERGLPLLGHERIVNHVAFSPDGSRVVTASDDGTAMLWSVKDGRVLRTLEGHAYKVFHAAFDPDGTRVVTGSGDGTARAWEASSGKSLFVLKGHTSRVAHVAFSPDGKSILTASWDGTARIWDAATGALRHRLEGHTDAVVQAAYSHDGARIATASWDSTARIWTAEDGSLAHELKGHAAAVWHVAFSPDDAQVITGSADGTARVWKTAGGSVSHTLEGHAGQVRWAGFSPNGLSVCTASTDSTARLWQAEDGEHLHTLEAHTGAVMCAGFSPDGGLLTTVSYDRAVLLWDVGTGSLRRRFEGHSGRILYGTFSPDGTSVASAGEDGTARLWRHEQGALLHELAGHTTPLRDIAFSPDGSLCCTTSGDSVVRLWNVEDGKLQRELSGHTSGCNQSAFSPDGKLVATASWDDTARVWQTGDGANTWRIKFKSDVTAVSFSPDSSLLLVASGDKTAALFRMSDGVRVQTFDGFEDWLQCATFSPDGLAIAVGTSKGHVGLYVRDSSEDDAWKPVPLKGHRDGVQRVVFSADGALLAAVSLDFTARIWSVADGSLVQVLEGHQYRAYDVAFSPDGTRVVTGATDKTARVWRVADGSQLHVLQHPHVVDRVGYSPDGRWIVTACEDGTARLWRAEDGTLFDYFAGHRDHLADATFSADGLRLATASSTGRIWSLGLDDLLARAFRLAAPHIRPETFTASERAWIEGASLEPLPRSTPGPRAYVHAQASVIRFHDSLRVGLEEARNTGRMVLLVFSRYNPP